jgi:hypothetical protein
MARQVKAVVNLSDVEGDSNVTVYHGGETYTATETHPMWERIMEGVTNADPSVVDLFDIGLAVSKAFLSERVSYANGYLFFDNDPVSDSLSEHIIRTVQEDGDYKPLVSLFENIQQNPSEHSREQLYRFLKANLFTITRDGKIVGYKGVHRTSDGGYESSNAGPAIINGVPHKEGRVPQKPGDVVEFPRANVDDNPHQGCSTGLHVATFDFAKGFVSGGPVLEVEVNPRDVVSVPTDSSDQKVRVCRYRVVQEVNAGYSEPVKPEGEAVAPQEEIPEQEAQAVAKHPSWATLAKAKQEAKLRKKGLARVMERRGFRLIDGQPGTDRKHWAAAA